MTLVVTTASRNGITLVGDRAVSQKVGDVVSVTDKEALKVLHSQEANIGFACWGTTSFPNGDYSDWLTGFVAGLPSAIPLHDAAELLAQNLNVQLRPIAERNHGWADLRRGIHVSGYVEGLPCIYHVHTGDPNVGHHELRVYRDFPDIHAGGPANYARNLANGMRYQLFNGFHELFGVIGESIKPLRQRLEKEFDVQIPAPTLRGQLELDRTFVRLAAGLLRASDRAPQVSVELFDQAFTATGRVEFPDIATDVPHLARTNSADITMSPAVPMTQSLWNEGVHGDGPG